MNRDYEDTPEDKEARRAALDRYNVLDTPPEEAFDRIARLAAHVCNAPIALVSLVDAHRQWHKAAFGTAVREVPLSQSICIHAIQTPGVTVIEDIAEDDRLDDVGSPMGDSPPRFYAGAPICTSDGHRLGTLCVLDDAPRDLAPEIQDRLNDLAAMVIDELELRRESARRRILAEAVDQAHDAVVITGARTLDPPGPRIEYVNPAFTRMTGYAPEEVLGQNPRILQGPDTDPEVIADLRNHLEAGRRWSGETINYRKDGTPIAIEWNVAPLRDELGNVTRWVSTQRDVTARRDVEAALRARSEWFRSITQNISDAVFRSTPDTGLLYANQAFVRMFGYPDVESVYELDPQTLYADPDVRQELVQAQKHGEGLEAEVRFQRADGTTFVGLLRTTVVQHEDGSVRYYDGAITDITHQKAAQHALRKSEAVNRAMLQAIPDLIFRLSEDGTFLDVQTHTFDVLATEAPIGKRMDDVLPPETAELGHRMIREALASRTVQQVEDSLTLSHGEERDFEARVAPLGENEVMAIVRDITDRTRREHRWRSLVERLPTGVVITVDGIYRFANPAAAQVVGVTNPKDLVGRSINEVLQSADYAVVQTRKEALARGEATDPWEHEIIGMDGRTRRVIVQSVPVMYEGQRAAQTVIRDVTDRYRREEELRRAKETAEEMNRLKSAFLANMSHEIRTPLTSIIGFAEALDGVDLEAPADQFAELIHRSGTRLLDTLNSVLDLSQLEAGSLELERSRVPVAAEVRAVVAEFSHRAEEKSVALQVRAPEAPVAVQADRTAFDRIVRNLVGNAVKFTPSGGRVTVEARPDGEAVELVVADTGIGVSDAFLPHLFDAFKQESEGLDRSHEGSGLGLAITKRLIDALGGSISVESQKGAGTRFRVRLPAAPVDEAAAAEPGPSASGRSDGSGAPDAG